MDVVSMFRTFTKLASARSISDVARKIGTSQSAVTRQIAALENHLGVRLLQITTRSLVLTEDGRELLAHANRILDAVEDAETWVGRRHKAPAGEGWMAGTRPAGAKIRGQSLVSSSGLAW